MKKPRIIKVILISLLLLILITVWYFLSVKEIISIPCLFHKITGLHCPGCGMSRAIISLMHLNVYQAIRYNALVIILVPGLIIYLIFKIKSYINNQPFQLKIPNYLIWLALIITILYGILRNIPLFDFLKPTVVL